VDSHFAHSAGGGGIVVTFDWFCRDDDEDLEIEGRPGVGRLRKKRSTPAVANIADLTGAGTPAFVPIGPSTALFGATTRRAPVAGRVRALAVSNDGLRAYAGTSGGLWYTVNAGATWIPLDAAASSRALDGELHDARALPVSSLTVQFGAAQTGADDIVFAGTGDPALESAIGPDGGRGIGIRTAVGPVPLMIAGNVPWTLEARNLAGAIVLALVRDRANVIWAATTDGLYKRPAANQENWDRVFTGLVWDVDVTRGVGAEPQRLWVATEGKLQWSSDGANFTDVALPDDFPLSTPNRPSIGRIRLAAARDVDPPHVWALASGGRLWRVDAAGASPVDGVPNDLSGLRGADRADLGLAIACAPANGNDVMVGGALSRTLTPEPAASVYRAVVVRLAGGRYTFFGATGAYTRVPPALAGIGVPGGVHAIAFAAGDPRQVWVSTDGGVFRSRDRGGAFASCNVGLPAFEIEQIADHARAEALLMGGAQVAGILQAAGVESSTTGLRYGGGGLTIDPADGRRIAAQRKRAEWFLSSDGRAFAPLRWFNAPSGTAPDQRPREYSRGDRGGCRDPARDRGAQGVVHGRLAHVAYASDDSAGSIGVRRHPPRTAHRSGSRRRRTARPALGNGGSAVRAHVDQHLSVQPYSAAGLGEDGHLRRSRAQAQEAQVARQPDPA
jgi:hypothetical protein